MRKVLNFLPIYGYMCPSGYYPIYLLPFYYCKNNGKIIFRWSLGWFCFSQLFKKKPSIYLEKTVWLRHLWINIKCFLFLPYIILNNYANGENIGLVD